MKLQTFATLALLGYTSAAPLGLRNSEWPVWPTANFTALKANTAGNEILKATVGSYPIGCMRMGGQTWMPQAQDYTAANNNIVTSTANRTFWGSTTAHTGTFVSGATAQTGTSAVVWGCCPGGGTALTKSNCAKSQHDDSGGSDQGAVGQVGLVWLATSGTFTQGKATGLSNGTSPKATELQAIYKTDISMVAANGLFDGSTYCEKQKVTNTATAATVSYKAAITGVDKCTTLIESAAGKAFGVTLKTLGYTDWQFFWLEFSDDAISAAPKGQILAATATPLFMGAFTASDGPFLNPMGNTTRNPLVATAITVAGAGTYVFNTDVYTDLGDGDVHGAGYIGEYSWTPQSDTPLLTSTVNTVPSDSVMLTYSSLTSEYNAYNSLVNTYKPLRDTYNKAIADEKARLADPLKAAFEKPIEIPTRPCAPTQPIDVFGPKIDLSKNTSAYASSTTNKTNKEGGLFRSAGGAFRSTDQIKIETYLTKTYGTADVSTNLQSGFAATTDVDTTAKYWTNTGKVFGKLGTGKATDATQSGTKGYRGKAASSAKNYMIVNMFPTKATITGKDTTFTLTQVELNADSDFNAPSRPGKESDPDTLGAKALAVASAAMLAVAASLY